MGYDVGKAIDAAFASIKEHFSLLFKAGLLLYVLPSFVIQVLAFLFIAFFAVGVSSLDSMSSPTALYGALGAGFVVLIILVVISSLLSLLYSITIIRVLHEKRQGVDLTLSQAISKGWSHFGSAILLSLLMGIALVLLYLLLIIPGIIFTIYWMFAIYALVIDNKGVGESLTFSKKIVSGSWWAMLLTIIVIVLASIVVSIVASMISVPLLFIPILGQIVSNAISLVISMLINIVTISFFEAIYIDLRNQKELPATGMQ